MCGKGIGKKEGEGDRKKREGRRQEKNGRERNRKQMGGKGIGKKW